METLLEGFRRFRETGFREHAGLFRHLALVGQRPRAVVIACCDSRVDPQMIFGAAPGDLFVIRNVANLVPPYRPDGDYHGTSAALEFAVREMGIGTVVVLGHTGCGGIKAMVEGTAGTDFLGSWMRIAAPVRERVLAEPDPAAAAEREAIRLSLANLLTFPWVAERAAAGTLSLHGCLFDVARADLLVLDADGEGGRQRRYA